MLPWPHRTLQFLNLSKVWRGATKYKRRHLTESKGSVFNGWQDQEIFLVWQKEKRRLFVATPQSLIDSKPCRTLAEPTNPVSAYKANTMVSADIFGTMRKKLGVFLLVSMAVRVVMISLQFVERA